MGYTLQPAGPILVDHEILGVSVHAVELEDARALAEADPKVAAGYLTVGDPVDCGAG